MNYKIRKATSADIETIIELCAEHAVYEQTEYSKVDKAEKLALHLFSETPRLYCLVAEKQSDIIGYATYMFEFSTWDAGFYVHMDCLFLIASARGYGIGEALIKEIAKAAELNGCKTLQWQTPEFNERAIKFYHRIGATSKVKKRFFFDIMKSIKLNI